jgi:hypothetical protein
MAEEQLPPSYDIESLRDVEVDSTICYLTKRGTDGRYRAIWLALAGISWFSACDRPQIDLHMVATQFRFAWARQAMLIE